MNPWFLALLWSLFLGLFVLSISWILALDRVLRLLRENCPEAYELMGAPSLFQNASVSSLIPVVKLVFSNRELRAKNLEIAQGCRSLRWILAFFSVGAIAFTALIVFALAVAPG